MVDFVGINSCGAVFVTDFYNLCSKGRRETGLTLSRLLTLGFGVAVILVALNVGRLGSVFEIANRIVNGFGSPLLAIFLLGMFSRRATSRGMLIGKRCFRMIQPELAPDTRAAFMNALSFSLTTWFRTARVGRFQKLKLIARIKDPNDGPTTETITIANGSDGIA